VKLYFLSPLLALSSLSTPPPLSSPPLPSSSSLPCSPPGQLLSAPFLSLFFFSVTENRKRQVYTHTQEYMWMTLSFKNKMLTHTHTSHTNTHARARTHTQASKPPLFAVNGLIDRCESHFITSWFHLREILSNSESLATVPPSQRASGWLTAVCLHNNSTINTR
jgi:hypothetical protein